MGIWGTTGGIMGAREIEILCAIATMGTRSVSVDCKDEILDFWRIFAPSSFVFHLNLENICPQQFCNLFVICIVDRD